MNYSETYTQISNLIQKKKNILILTHAKADCDGLGAALSAYLTLKKLNKNVTVVTNDPTPENLQFLPAIDILSNSLLDTKDFIITVDSGESAISKIKYNVEGKKVNIIITPKNGFLSADQVSFSQASHQYDLILIFDTGNLEHLGGLYEKNVEMFFETPIVNIDHHASNTDFGQINLVDSTASSATEVLFGYLKHLEKEQGQKLIDEDIATLLIAGIITDTGSYQHANTSPRALETSAELLDLGARQQEVIKNIFKTKKLSTLKLWGTILAKVQNDPVHRIVWSTLSQDDFKEVGAETGETEGIIDELLSNAPGAEVIFLIKQTPEYVSVSLRSTSNQVNVGQFAAENGGGGHVRAAGFKVYKNQAFEKTVSEIITKVQEFQANRLELPSAPSSNSAKKKAEASSIAPSRPTPEPKETYLDFDSPEENLDSPEAEEDIDLTDSFDQEAEAIENPVEEAEDTFDDSFGDDQELVDEEGDFGLDTEEGLVGDPDTFDESFVEDDIDSSDYMDSDVDPEADRVEFLNEDQSQNEPSEDGEMGFNPIESAVVSDQEMSIPESEASKEKPEPKSAPLSKKVDPENAQPKRKRRRFRPRKPYSKKPQGPSNPMSSK